MNTNKRKKTFETELMDSGRLKNLGWGTFFFLNTFYSSNLIKIMTLKQFLIFSGIVFFISIFSQFIIAPFTNRFLTKDISDRLEKNEQSLLDTNERTKLLKDLYTLPHLVTIEVILVIAAAAVTPIIILILKFHININTFFHVMLCCLSGLYISGLAAYCYTENLCCKNAINLIEQGINKETIHKDKFYGASTKKRFFYSIIIPILLSSLLQLTVFNISISENFNNLKSIHNIIFVVFINTIICIVVGYNLHKTLTVNTKNITKILENLTEHKNNLILPTDLNHELSYSIFLINEIIDFLSNLSNKASNTGKEIFDFSQNLSKNVNITAKTSITESLTIKKILETMANGKKEHDKIFSKINLIQNTAFSTTEKSNVASELIKNGINKINQISKSNLDTVYNIKELSETIYSINSVINTIETITEKIKTIALNADFKTTIIENNGNKVHIIANEIIDITSAIKKSTTKIRKKINDILHSCDNLIISNELGIQKTKKSNEIYIALEQNFNDLCIFSEITAESLRKIVDITTLQQDAFSQVNNILLEINLGFDSFSQNYQKIELETKTLNAAATNLGFLQNVKRR